MSININIMSLYNHESVVTARIHLKLNVTDGLQLIYDN